jgi:diguanylate cyclase (GGDEF)-like protein
VHALGIAAVWWFLRAVGEAAANPLVLVAACLARVVAQQLVIWASHALATERPPLAYALVGLRGQAWFLCQEVLLGLCLTEALRQAPVLGLAIVAVLFVEGQVGRRLMVAAESSVALRLQAEAEADRARRDGLTDLLNRRGLDEALAVRRVVTGVLLIDIDHFKHINDGFGHQVGDQVLRAVAAAVRASVRPADQCARYGGEELCVLLPGIDTHESLFAAAERIRLAIACIHLPEWPHLSVTASVGAGVLRPGCDELSELALVDQALYRAKERGRNQVQLSVSAHRQPSERPAA